MNELIDLVETMRQAQAHRDKMLADRDTRYGAHQVRRAEQAAKVAQDRVDAYIKQYRADQQRLKQVFDAGQLAMFGSNGQRATDEQRAPYRTE